MDADQLRSIARKLNAQGYNDYVVSIVEDAADALATVTRERDEARDVAAKAMLGHVEAITRAQQAEARVAALLAERDAILRVLEKLIRGHGIKSIAEFVFMEELSAVRAAAGLDTDSRATGEGD